MTEKIRISRIILGLLIVGATIGAGWSAWEAFAGQQVEFVNVFAGSAAILSAAISATIAFRSAELTEERLRPYPYPYIDTSSRYSLAQLRIRNVGGTAAHRVYLEWTGSSVPRLHKERDGSVVPLLANGKENAIAVLLPYDSLAQALDVPDKIAEQAKARGQEWKGYVNFRDSRGQKHRHPFILDVTNLRHGLLYDNEEPKTMYELQKLPEEIGNLTNAVKGLKKA
jgi:hypothetical protein